MPCVPSHVEKLTNHIAKPTTDPASSSATWQNTFGSDPNRTSRSFASVATTASGSRSYVASSLMSCRTTGTSSRRARRTELMLVPCSARLGLLGLPEDLVDLGDLLQQL